jgi:hypothetical protein
VAIVDLLLETAREDTDLLLKNDARGDHFSRPRDVDFLLRAPSKEKAELVASFVEDNRYGIPKVQEDEGEFSVLVTVHMPTEQHVLCSISGLMACISTLFGLEYDGWGCVLQTDT